MCFYECNILIYPLYIFTFLFIIHHCFPSSTIGLISVIIYFYWYQIDISLILLKSLKYLKKTFIIVLIIIPSNLHSFFCFGFYQLWAILAEIRTSLFFTRKSKFTNFSHLTCQPKLSWHYSTKKHCLFIFYSTTQITWQNHHYHQSLSSSSSICLQMTLPLYLCEMLSYHYLKYLLNQHQINHISYHQSQSSNRKRKRHKFNANYICCSPIKNKFKRDSVSVTLIRYIFIKFSFRSVSFFIFRFKQD